MDHPRVADLVARYQDLATADVRQIAYSGPGEYTAEAVQAARQVLSTRPPSETASLNQDAHAARLERVRERSAGDPGGDTYSLPGWVVAALIGAGLITLSKGNYGSAAGLATLAGYLTGVTIMAGVVSRTLRFTLFRSQPDGRRAGGVFLITLVLCTLFYGAGVEGEPANMVRGFEQSLFPALLWLAFDIYRIPSYSVGRKDHAPEQG
jgi:hypothetical protein